jgi:hypothetical protein
MNHVLNNPVWNAAISANSHLVSGSKRVKLFDQEVSPFAALSEPTVEQLLELYELHTGDGIRFLWADALLPIPESWKTLHCIPGLQMVYLPKEVPRHEREGIVPLTEKNIPAMLALTKLTKPGPFGTRTIEFGNYEGIFVDGQLAAMTGQRFHCFDHIEISAVCTHPDHQGKGYARKLLLSQLAAVIDSGATPYLHVKSDNDRAIQVYESIGFTKRLDVYFYVIAKQQGSSPQSYP